ncbi:MAG: amylo-alpha-1,6-glucosidase [Tepidisphaeraceae bacterium]
MPPLFSFDTTAQPESWRHREWLLSNGLGAFGSSTVSGMNSRRYHGLLCAAALPPVGRVMALSRVGEIITLDAKDDQLIELSVNQFADGRVHPTGDRYLRRFDLDDTARWTFDVDGVIVTKELQLLWMRNAILLRYTIESPTPRPIRFQLLPFVALRDFHGLRRAEGSNFRVFPDTGATGARVEIDQHVVYMRAQDNPDARFETASDWWYGHVYPIESERGLDDTEDLFNPGRWTVTMDRRAGFTLIASTDPFEESFDWNAELARRRAAITPRPPEASTTIGKLYRAADDFVVARKCPDGSAGSTVLAGYPWFADWGRDTMIALPGLLLVTKRFKQAAQVLGVFANYVSEGMIPNRFDDYTNEPHYNTVDASLWFVHACFEYVRLSGDYQTFEKTLLPACRAIVGGYRKGTRFNIHMDQRDGLITQGDAHTQLTWMDAKCGEVAFTPRQGKAVEINALWYHALVLMKEEALAAKVRDNFARAFYLSPFRGLADVLDDGGKRDTSIRPNQIFAVSLANSPLDEAQQRAVVEVVRRELLTPVGLRTLAPADPRYHWRYTGGPMQRDEAYHNGTVWPWPMGAFLEAYLRVNQRSPESIAQAKAWLQPLLDSMNDGCVGQISECFEPEPPHRPVAAPAQAWSVAEALRLATELGM